MYDLPCNTFLIAISLVACWFLSSVSNINRHNFETSLLCGDQEMINNVLINVRTINLVPIQLELHLYQSLLRLFDEQHQRYIDVRH
jgi:hypothetical protein